MWPNDLCAGSRQDHRGCLDTRRRSSATLPYREALADVVAVLDEYAGTGRLRIPRELNDLDLAIGLREIKVGSARFPFYELTDSVHTVTDTRLTHGFAKGTQETPRGVIGKAKWAIEQDRRHT